jgi:hypothetical protein
MGLLCALVAYHAERARDQRHAVERVLARGGQVVYDVDYYDGATSGSPAARSAWLTTLENALGRDLLYNVVVVKYGQETFHLSADSTRVTFESVQASIHDDDLAELKLFPRLKELWMDQTGITDAGLAHIAQLSELEVLHLDGAALTDKSLESLASLPRLAELSISDVEARLERGETILGKYRPSGRPRLSDNALVVLAQFPSLRILDIRGNNISGHAIMDFKRRLPNCDVLH